MEAEVISMFPGSQLSRPIFHYGYGFFVGESGIGSPVNKATMNVSIHKKNVGALVLAETLRAHTTVYI